MQNKKAINKKKLQDGGKVRQIQTDTYILHFFIHAWARLYWTVGGNNFANDVGRLVAKGDGPL